MIAGGAATGGAATGGAATGTYSGGMSTGGTYSGGASRVIAGGTSTGALSTSWGATTGVSYLVRVHLLGVLLRLLFVVHSLLPAHNTLGLMTLCVICFRRHWYRTTLVVLF